MFARIIGQARRQILWLVLVCPNQIVKIGCFMKLFISALLCLFIGHSHAASVLIYHHVSDKTPKSTSVTVEQLVQHLDLIDELGLQVVPLTDITDAIKQKRAVPDNWVAITFDDGYRNVYDNAFPILQQRQIPFTVFVNPSMVKPSKLYMDWNQLKELSDAGAIIANHTLAHENLVQDGLTTEQIIKNINAAEAQIQQHLGQNHKMLAYPYGEYNEEVENALAQQGYIAFAQHSGAIDKTSNLTALMRFPANGIYANVKTLKNKVNSLAFDIKSVTPRDTAPSSTKPELSVELNSKDFYKSQLACFITGSGQPQKPTWLSDTKFVISANSDIPTGRVKYNCTAPSIKHKGRFYWMSKMWINQG